MYPTVQYVRPAANCSLFHVQNPYCALRTCCFVQNIDPAIVKIQNANRHVKRLASVLSCLQPFAQISKTPVSGEKILTDVLLLPSQPQPPQNCSLDNIPESVEMCRSGAPSRLETVSCHQCWSGLAVAPADRPAWPPATPDTPPWLPADRRCPC